MLSRVGSMTKGRPVRVRVGVMGAARVGKTSIIEMILNERFSKTYCPTVEDLYSVDVDLGKVTATRLEFLDTAGSYTFPAMRRLAITTCHIFMLVYAIDDSESFQEVLNLYKQIKDFRSELEQVPILLVGNKIDLHKRRVVTRLEVDRRTFYWKMMSAVEMSAMQGLFVNDVMEHLMISIKAKTPQDECGYKEHGRLKRAFQKLFRPKGLQKATLK